MKNILIVDDEEILRMLILDTLEDLECELDEAENGKIALEKIENKTYDLLILDYMMPEVSGIDVLHSIPKKKKDNLKILMLTAKTQEKDKIAMLEAGADYIMAKPFSPIDLLNFIEEQLYGE